MASILDDYCLVKTANDEFAHVMAYCHDRKSMCGQDFSQYNRFTAIRLLDKYVEQSEAEECLCQKCEQVLIDSERIVPCWALQIFEVI